MDPDFISADYIQVQESNIDFDGDGRVDLVISDLDHKLCLVKLVIPVSVRDDWRANAPADFVLAQNYPNPFNPATHIAYYLPSRTHVTLAVYNALGQAVRTLVNDVQEQGSQEVFFDGRDLAERQLFLQAHRWRRDADQDDDDGEMNSMGRRTLSVPFETSVIGSLPRPRWVLELVRAREEKRISDEEFERRLDDAVPLAVRDPGAGRDRRHHGRGMAPRELYQRFLEDR